MILAAGFEKTICSTALVLWKIYADYVWFWENLVLSNTGFEGKKTYAAQHLFWKKYYDRQTWFSEKTLCSTDLVLRNPSYLRRLFWENIMPYNAGLKKNIFSTNLCFEKRNCDLQCLFSEKHYALPHWFWEKTNSLHPWFWQEL